MREPQFPRTALHGTRIMRLAMFQEEEAVAVHCADDRQRVFSALLDPMVPPVPRLRRAHARTSVVFLR
jgi:hypothetical protein